MKSLLTIGIKCAFCVIDAVGCEAEFDDRKYPNDAVHNIAVENVRVLSHCDDSN